MRVKSQQEPLEVRLNRLVEDVVAVGREHFNAAKIEQAREHFSYALQLDPYHPGARFGRGACNVKLEQFEEGREDLDVAIEFSSDYFTMVRAHFYRGLALLDLDRPEPAIEDFDEYIARVRPSAQYSGRIYRAEAYFKLGIFDGALADLDQAIASETMAPDNHSFGYYIKGVVNMALKHYDKAVSDITKSMSLSSDLNNAADCHAYAAFCHYQRSDIQKAKEEYARALACDPIKAIQTLLSPLTTQLRK